MGPPGNCVDGGRVLIWTSVRFKDTVRFSMHPPCGFYVNICTCNIRNVTIIRDSGRGFLEQYSQAGASEDREESEGLMNRKTSTDQAVIDSEQT